MEDIARRAELSKGAFYLHFESKEQIFDELVVAVASSLESMLAAATECYGGETLSIDEHLEVCFAQDLRIFEFIRDNRGMMALMLEGGGSGRHCHLIEGFAERTERVVSTNLRRGVVVGLYRADLDCDSAAAFIAGGYDRVARNLIKTLLDGSAEYDLPSHLACVVRQVIAGVGTLALAEAAQRLPQLARKLSANGKSDAETSEASEQPSHPPTGTS